MNPASKFRVKAMKLIEQIEETGEDYDRHPFTQRIIDIAIKSGDVAKLKTICNMLKRELENKLDPDYESCQGSEDEFDR